MKYNIDLERLSLQEYKDLIKKQNLLPGRRILWQDIDKNFALFENEGIKNTADLKKFLANGKKVEIFVSQSGISEEYLVILKREIGSLEQKPVLLSVFPGINIAQLEELNKSGIKTSKDYWDKKREAFDELFCLCDLVRINGVGPIAARVFYEAGYRTISDIALADAEEMLAKVSAVNEVHHYFKLTLGVKDMQFCIDFALMLNKYAS